MKNNTFYFKLFAATIISLCVFTQSTYSCIVTQKTILKADPYFDDCFQQYSKIQQDCSLNTVEKKLEAWSKFKKKCSKDGTYEGNKAMLYFMAGDSNRAIEILQKALKEAHYNTVENNYLLAGILYSKGELEATKTLAEKLVKEYPQYFNGYALLGAYYITYRNWELAKYYLEKAYTLNDRVWSVQAYLSTVYYQYNRYDDTVKLYYEAYNDEPYATILERLSTVTVIDALIHLNRLKEAQQLLNEQLLKDSEVKDYKSYKIVKGRLKKAFIAREGR